MIKLIVSLFLLVPTLVFADAVNDNSNEYQVYFVQKKGHSKRPSVRFLFKGYNIDMPVDELGCVVKNYQRWEVLGEEKVFCDPPTGAYKLHLAVKNLDNEIMTTFITQKLSEADEVTIVKSEIVDSKVVGTGSCSFNDCDHGMKCLWKIRCYLSDFGWFDIPFKKETGKYDHESQVPLISPYNIFQVGDRITIQSETSEHINKSRYKIVVSRENEQLWQGTIVGPQRRQKKHVVGGDKTAYCEWFSGWNTFQIIDGTIQIKGKRYQLPYFYNNKPSIRVGDPLIFLGTKELPNKFPHDTKRTNTYYIFKLLSSGRLIYLIDINAKIN